MRGGMSVPWGGGCSRGMGVPGGWVFQGDECSRESWSLTQISSSQMPKYLFHLTYFHLLDFIEKHKLLPIYYFKVVIIRLYIV